jgi:hypothetical protein
MMSATLPAAWQLCTCILKGTVSPDNGFSFMVYKITQVLFIGPLLIFDDFISQSMCYLKFCFKTVSMKSLNKYANFLSAENVLKLKS